MGLTLRPDAFRAWVDLCVEGLAKARAEIDALNVFPVPDRDTGTTYDAAAFSERQASGTGPNGKKSRQHMAGDNRGNRCRARGIPSRCTHAVRTCARMSRSPPRL